jgi:hypothetical protein
MPDTLTYYMSYVTYLMLRLVCRVCRLRLTASIPMNSEDIDRPAALPPRIRLLFATKATQLPKDISQEEGLSRNLGIAISSARPLEHLPDASALRPLLQQLALNRSSVLFVVRPVLQLAVEAISLLTERDHAQLGLARAVPSSAKWVCEKIAKPPSASGRPAWRRRPDIHPRIIKGT